jgi:hypothetical protein
MKLSRKSIDLGMAKLDLYAQMMYLLGDVLNLFRKMTLSFETEGDSAKITEEMYNEVSENILPQIAEIFEKEEVLARRMDQEAMGILQNQEEETFH